MGTEAGESRWEVVLAAMLANLGFDPMVIKGLEEDSLPNT